MFDEPVTRPILPPKDGYVEFIENGEHVYRQTPTGEILAIVQENSDAIDQIIIDILEG